MGARILGACLLQIGVIGSCLLGACARADAPAERALFELERMVLVQPGAPRLIGPFGYVEGVGADRALLVDRFEVTRDDWAHYFGAPPDPGLLRADNARTDEERGDWPAFASYLEALELCGRRGMRLPTAGEWLYLGVGPRGQRYPWGRLRRASVANTQELGLARPLPVGCFENGRSDFGCYDLLGNVMEWISGSLPSETPEPALDPARFGDPAIAMGGSYLSRAAELYTRDEDRISGLAFPAHELPSGTRTPEVGLRCVVEAAEWIAPRLAELSRAAGAEQRLAAVGADFGPQALPLLDALEAELDGGDRAARRALEWLRRGASP